jgi:hypothetical protein
VAFYVIYIEEAHPIDGWQMPVNVKDHVLLASAKNLDERDSAAKTCVVTLCISIPAWWTICVTRPKLPPPAGLTVCM